MAEKKRSRLGLERSSRTHLEPTMSNPTIRLQLLGAPGRCAWDGSRRRGAAHPAGPGMRRARAYEQEPALGAVHK